MDFEHIRLTPSPYIHPTAGIVDSQLGAYTYIGEDCRIKNSSIGAYSHCSPRTDIFATELGKFASIATDVRINPTQHPTYSRVAQSHITYRCSAYGFGEDDAELFAWRERHRVVVGHDVWFGYNVTVLGGVTIGNGAVLGSMAVVTKDVEPYSIVVGNPARHIKYRFEPDVIACIERSAWWDWTHDELHARLKDFNDIEAFCEKYGC